MAVKCGQGTVNDNCATEQSFCTIKGGQSVSTIVNTNDKNLATIIAEETFTQADIWNRIYAVLQYIYNYPGVGQEHHGTRNPIITGRSSVNIDETIFLQFYNDVLSTIDIENLSQDSYPKISKVLMDNLQTYINNYKFNSNRCISCNTACNTTCEAADQCTCSNQNDQCGGGSGDGGCACSQYGCLGYFQGECSATTNLGSGCTY